MAARGGGVGSACVAVLAALGLVGLAACDRENAARPAVAPPKPPAQTGVASYYGREFAGKPTASGKPHKPDAMTAASRTLPLGSTAQVTNTETGKSVSVEIDDRGPYAKNRVIDVSPKAAEQLGMKEDGVAKVEVQPSPAPAKTPPPPPLVGR